MSTDKNTSTNTENMSTNTNKNSKTTINSNNISNDSDTGMINESNQDKETIIEKKEDTKEKMQEFYNSNIKKLLVIAQTTYSMKDFSDISDEIKKSIQGRNITLEIKNTICNATKLRQEETKELARKVECMIIVGGKNSSNTNKLFNIAKTYCKNSLLVETREEINVNDIKKLNKIGIMAGASTPKKSIDAIVELLQSI